MIRNIFSKNFFLKLRFFLLVILATIFIVVDVNSTIFNNIKRYTTNIIGILSFMAHIPYQTLEHTLNILKGREQLVLENCLLNKELLLKNNELLLMEYYKKENHELRKLLASSAPYKVTKILTQVILNNTDFCDHQIIVDKGIRDGICVGQVAVSKQGVVGQVIYVNQLTSKIMLICDTNHALPVQIQRNGIRLIAIGYGCNTNLHLECISGYTDIKVGDILVTSGLGDRFPQGYPVAIIAETDVDVQFMQKNIKAKPLADLQNLNYLLLISTSK